MLQIIIIFLTIPTIIISQNTIEPTLNTNTKEVPQTGFNGNTIRGPSWGNTTFNDSVKTMQPKLLRYPGGNIANYWNWDTGWFYNQSTLDTALVDTIYSLPPAWSNLDQIDIRPTQFQNALNQINSEGIYVLNMMSTTLPNHITFLQNAIDSGVVINYIELGSEFNHNNPYSAIKFPTSGDYARECNIWIDSIKTKFPNIKIGVVAGNRGEEPSRSWDWNDSICSIVNGADALIWHMYVYLHDEDTTYTNKQILAYPFYRVPLYEKWRGFKDTINQIQNYELWVTEYNLFDQTSDKRFTNTWAHVLMLAGINNEFLEHNLIKIMLQHNVGGIFTNFDALDTENNFKKRSSGFSGLIWNNQMSEMTNVKKINFTNSIVDSVDYTNSNGVVNQVFFPKLFGWRFNNESEESIIIVNISNDTININTQSILSTTPNWTSWTGNTLFEQINGNTNINKDETPYSENIIIPPMSINTTKKTCYNDTDGDGVCDELEVDGCEEDQLACNYNATGTQECLYPIDIYGVNYVDCDGVCLNDNDPPINNLSNLGDGVCDEVDNCPNTYNPNQNDFNQDGIGDDCDGLDINENHHQKKLINIIDVLGRSVSKEKKETILLYIYDNGEIKQKYKF